MTYLPQSIALVTLLFIVYHFIVHSLWFEKWFMNRYGCDDGQMVKVFAQRLMGFILFGIVPLFYVIGIKQLSIFDRFGFANPKTTLMWSLGLGLLAVLINSRAARSSDNLSMYPQIRRIDWTRTLITLSAITWVAYLFAYEFMFRGVLLSLCLMHTDVYTAITINTAIYVLVHVPKGYKEAFGAIPVGIGLCLITIYTGNIWVAIIAHCALALSNEWFSIKYHSEMYLKLPSSES